MMLIYSVRSIGEALIDAIDELINQGRIEPQLAMKILTNFDKAIAENIAASVKSRLTFKVCVEYLYEEMGYSRKADCDALGPSSDISIL